MDPATSLQTAETALRLVISAVLGDQWQATPGIDVAALERKREDDRRRRRGAIVDEHLASYLEFRELKEIILKRWDDGFDPVFGHKDRTEVLLTILGDVRNAIAHSRQLLPFEVDLASGISGRLRNQITIYRTSRRPADEHYPVIESVQDQYGQWGGDWVQTDIATTRLRLDVGDTVTFVCQGSDQQGRALEWLLGFDTVNSAHDAKTSPPLGVGDRVTVTWTVTEEDVGEKARLAIVMRAREARFHRSRDDGYDGIRWFTYSVNPPRR